MDKPDFIIVGAGSAGCVLAERLTRNGRHTVTLIEAGGSDKRFWIQVPLGYGRTFYDPSVNWMYETEADPGLNGRTDYWPRGKVLGGSSSINAMVYIRGQQADFDDWAALGNDGWAWRDVAPHFEALEGKGNASGRSATSETPSMHVNDMRARTHPLSARLLEAGEQIGLPLNEDFNGATQEGVGHYRLTTTPNSWRMSAARAFLWPARRRPNLRVITHAHAEKILIEDERAVGVRYRRRGTVSNLEAAREVIVATGAIGSPQLLQLSGIGDAEHLRSIGVDVTVNNSNVGAHLQDHLGLSYAYRSRIPTLNSVLGSWPKRIAAGLRYLASGKGPLGQSVNETGGFCRTPGSDRPNIQLYCQVLTTTTASGTRPLLMPDPFPAFTLGLSSCRPKSRGTVTITDANPDTSPAIQPNSFSHPDDMREMIAGVKVLNALSEAPAFRSVIEPPVSPEPDFHSDDDIAADVRARSGTVFHPSCTCRMGLSPTNSVVDNRLRVHGMRGLRVIDASVFPSITSGNLNAPSMMVGAKGAEMILEDART